MSAKATQTDESPREQTARVCDEIRDKLGLEENKGAYTLTQTEKRAILDALRGERSPRGVAWVAGATGLAPDTTEEWLGRLARSGRATETADGWTV